MRKPFIIAYDVSDPARLHTVRLAVTDWAHGGQKSVWECWARNPDRMLPALQLGLNPSADRLALLRPVLTRSRSLGAARFSRDAPLIFIGEP